LQNQTPVAEDDHSKKYFDPFILGPDSEGSKRQIDARQTNGRVACKLVERVYGLAIYLPVLKLVLVRSIRGKTHEVESRATALDAE
jgi:hypothetical protein